jgi:hypothetical protein
VLPPSPQPTRLVIQADYEVRVAIPGRGGEPESKSRHDIVLAPGRYQVEISAPYPPAFLHAITVPIELAEGRMVVHPMPPLRVVTVSAFPGNGLVRVNGIYAGPTPLLDFRIPAGEHEFRFEWPTGKTITVRERIVNDGQRVFATAPN